MSIKRKKITGFSIRGNNEAFKVIHEADNVLLNKTEDKREVKYFRNGLTKISCCIYTAEGISI